MGKLCQLNPVRANMTNSPAQYRWSSYRFNGMGKENTLVTPHALYLSLGKTQGKILDSYRAIFNAHVDEEEMNNIRAACQTGTPLGNEYFKEKIERKLNSKVGQARRGSPSKRL